MAAKSKDFVAKPNPMNGRCRLISGNWKMNLNHLEAIALVQKLHYSLRESDYHYAEISVHPPFTALRSIQLLLETDRVPISLGAQNTYFETSGPFTGEVSPSMLNKLGVKYVIVGHSERRDIFGETDEVVTKKTKAILDAQMIPIVCVGESLKEKQEEMTEAVLAHQVEAVVSGVNSEGCESLVFAYEPKWAIGSGMPAGASDAVRGAEVIRATVSKFHGEEVASKVRVQYGGSVNSANAKEFMEQKEIDGLLVGGASLSSEAFAAVIQA